MSVILRSNWIHWLRKVSLLLSLVIPGLIVAVRLVFQYARRVIVHDTRHSAQHSETIESLPLITFSISSMSLLVSGAFWPRPLYASNFMARK
jgi:hypothetical protein